MNEFQSELYSNLMNLIKNNEAFYFSDHEKNGHKFRIFLYRLASYTDFCEIGAVECRGSMFEIEGEDYDAVPVRLASLPMEKFWNLNENPFTMDLDLSQVKQLEDKADGSLISSYMTWETEDFTEYNVYFKSKGSLHSDQAVDALEWCKTNDPDLFRDIKQAERYLNATVNMEWVAPHNRIVLNYDKPELKVLNVRYRFSGMYMDFDKVAEHLPTIADRWTARINTDDTEAFIKTIPEMKDIEGFVIQMNDGQRVKIKTQWYLARHHTKDSVNNPRRLFEAVIEEATDDMRSMFFDDPVALKLISNMESFVEGKYNHMVDAVERFYKRNSKLDRKDYAIKGKQELESSFFSLAMNLYLGRENDYKDYLKRQWKKMGLKDEATKDE